MDLHVLATAILNHAAQLTLLAALVWCAAKLFARNRPHLAHALWILVLIKCVVPPAWSSPTSLFNLNALNFASIPTDPNQNQSHATHDNSSIANDAGNVNELIANSSDFQLSVDVGEENETPINSETIETPWFTDPKAPTSRQPFLNVPQSAIAFGVCTLVIGFAAGLLITCARLLWFIRAAYSKGYYSDAEIDDLVCLLSKRLGVKRFVTVRLVRNPIGPVVLGLIRPTLLLPDLIVRGRKLSELEPLIAHELIHVRRGDLWWSMLQAVATSLWWFHPLVRLAGRMLSRETERSCDEETVACLGCSPAAYARSLLDVLERKHQLQIAPALPGVRPIEVTLDRMERIMKLGQGSHKRTPGWIWAALFIACAVVLPSGSVGVAQDANALESATPTQAVQTQTEANDAEAELLLSYREDVGMRRMTYLQQILRELQVSGTVSEIDEIKTKLQFLRETCKKHISCEVRIVQFKKDDFKEVSENGSLTRPNPNGVTVIDSKEVAVEGPSVDTRMRAALDAVQAHRGLAFEFARPCSYSLNEEEFDAILKREDIRCVTAPRVTGRSSQTVTMSFQSDSKADDENFLQGTSLELTPEIVEGDRISLQTKYSIPIINKKLPWNDTGGHGKRVLDALRIQNPKALVSADATLQLALVQAEQGKMEEAAETFNELLDTYPDSQLQFLTTEAPIGKTHVICLPTKVDGEAGVLVVLVKCSVVDHVPVIGPATAGLVHEIPQLENHEVMHALNEQREANGKFALDSEQYSRIEIEKLAESKDDKRLIPMIGDAVLHHTFYQCTVYLKDPDERHVVFIDHNHFHKD